MWADTLTKPKQGGPFCLDRSHLMNIPINYVDNAKRHNTHPLLLPSDERPIVPKRMKVRSLKTLIFHSRSVLGIRNPSPMKPFPGTPPLLVSLILIQTPFGNSRTWADRLRNTHSHQITV